MGCDTQSTTIFTTPPPTTGTITQSGSLPSSLCIDKHCFSLRYAITPVEREQGLMNVAILPETEGMLFDFGQAQRSAFWMKNTLIPLDIIRLDDTGTVQGILHNAQPCVSGQECPSRGPGIATRFVLEIPGGAAKKHGIREGTVLSPVF